MRRFFAKRWVWVTALFAVINIVGLAAIVSVLRQPTRGLRVEAFEPEGQASPDTGIVVRFNQTMVTAAEVGQELPDGLLSVVPAVPGKAVWRDKLTAAFEPAERLPMATAFAATVSRKLRSLLGHSLPADAIFQFHTAPLQLLAVRQTALRHGRLSLALEFNDKVVPDEAKAHLTLSGKAVKSVPFSLQGRTPSRVVALTTDAFPEGTLTVTLTKGLRGASGPLGIEADQTLALAIEDAVRIESVTAHAEAPDHATISATCTQPIEPDDAAPHIQVEPKVAFRLSSTYDGLQLAGPFLSGHRYRVTFQQGLPARNGSTLSKEVVRSIVIPDIEPSLRFKTSGIYLSAQGSLLLPLEGINTRAAELHIEQVYPNNVVHCLRDFNSYRAHGTGDLTRTVCKEAVTFAQKPNESQVKPLDLRKLLGKDPRGVFIVSAGPKDEPWRHERRLILVTDLGLTVKRSAADLLVWVNALSTAQPVEGAAVSVYSRANQPLATGTTDANGIAHFKDLDGTGDKQPFAVAATKDADTGFVEIEPTRLDDSDLDTGGRPYLAKGYEAYVYGDRGIYRPGSKVALHAIVRGKETGVPQPFPLQFRVLRPDGRLFKTLTAKLNAWGSAEVQLDVPAYALTGRYSVELRTPGAETAIGTHTFQVEDFMPDRMKVAITLPARRYAAGEEISFTVKATHLFGAPAAGRTVEAKCAFVGEDFSPAGWQGYRFCDGARKFSHATEKLGEATLDKNGEGTFTLRVPNGLTPPSALRAILSASVSEVGGRAVTATQALGVDCTPHYVGLARASKEHAQALLADKLLVAAVKPDGSPVERLALEGTVYRVMWNSVLKLDNGHYRFTSEREEKALEPLACTVANGRGEVTFKPPAVGEYLVRLTDKASGASADLAFYCAGQGDVPWAMDKPARIALAADKPAYAPGDTARILIKAPFAGRALCTVETDRIHLARVVAMEKNTAEFAFPVAALSGANAYCSVTVIRKATPNSPWAVHRAFGTIPVMLDATPRQLQVELVSVEDTRPGKPLRVALRVRDAAGAGRKAEVTLAAVDEGICQLTKFETPNPWDFFFAKRQLGVQTSDVYSLLMPEPDKKKLGADSAPGGDGGSEYDPRLLNPVNVERVKQVALWQSGIETGDDGKAEVVLDVPEFTGQLRLMAVAASGSEFGASERPTRVKQPLMVQTSFPRFLAPGDEFTIPVTLFNNTGKAGKVQLTARTTGGVQLLSDAPGAADVENGREATVSLHARAPEVPGPVSIRLEARLGSEEAVETVEIPVRPPTTLQFVSGSGSVAAGQSAQFALPGNWVKGTERAWLSFSPLPTLKLGASLRYLLRYPYGCIEQTTSTGFPLLYLGDVAKVVEPELDGKEAEGMVQAAIDRVLSMQTFEGGFGFWPGYAEVYPWGSAYATHFLVEAKKAGFDVPQDNLDAAIRYLDDLLAKERDEAGGLQVKTYACLVLAQAGKPNRSWTLRLHEQKDELPAYSRFQLAAALALMKEDRLANQLLAAAALPPAARERDTGGVLHSAAREAAILLSVYLDLKREDPNVPLLIQRLSGLMADGRWASTQENAFALMALGKYARLLAAEKSDFKAEVTAGGERLASLTSRDSLLVRPKDVTGKTIHIATQGTGTLYYYWGVEGIPTKEVVVEKDTSLKIRRRFLSREGQELDLRQVKQGEIAIVELTVDNGVAVQNLVINDLLAAGFEIENPRLATSEQVANADAEVASGLRPPASAGPRPLRLDRVEMRDDRLIVFADLPATGVWSHRYVVRAVTCGRFRLPAINAFCMYNPAISSVHGAGTVAIGR